MGGCRCSCRKRDRNPASGCFTRRPVRSLSSGVNMDARRRSSVILRSRRLGHVAALIPLPLTAHATYPHGPSRQHMAMVQGRLSAAATPVKVLGLVGHALQRLSVVDAALQRILCQQLHAVLLARRDHLGHNVCATYPPRSFPVCTAEAS